MCSYGFTIQYILIELMIDLISFSNIEWIVVRPRKGKSNLGKSPFCIL